MTRRQAELVQLMGALAAVIADGWVVGIHALDAMTGIGKTTSRRTPSVGNCADRPDRRWDPRRPGGLADSGTP